MGLKKKKFQFPINTRFYKIILFFWLANHLWMFCSCEIPKPRQTQRPVWTSLNLDLSPLCCPPPAQGVLQGQFYSKPDLPGRKCSYRSSCYVATSGADQTPSHHNRRQLLLSHTEASWYEPIPWGVLRVYGNHWTVCGQPRSSEVSA